MPTINLTLPVSGTVVTAGLHATNYSTIQTVVNGGIDNNNFATGKIFDPAKLTQNGATTGQVLAWNGTNWAPAAGGITQLFDSTLGSAAASFDITSISGAYSALKLTLYGRSDNGTTTVSGNLRFNNDSAANYDWQYLQGSAASATAAESFAQTSSLIANAIPASSAGANLFGEVELWVPHYAGTANNKAIASSWALKTGTASGNMQAGQVAGFWRSNSAITRVTVLPGAGNFVAGSRCTLYGMI